MAWIAAFSLLLVTGCIQQAYAQEERPILIIGDWSGTNDRPQIIADILEPTEAAFEDGGTWLAPEEWKNYSLVILNSAGPVAKDDEGRFVFAAPNTPTPIPLSSDETDTIRQYLEGGGRLILTGQALKFLQAVDPQGLDWVGATGAGAVSKGAIEMSGQVPSWLAGANVEDVFRHTSATSPQKLTTATPWITRGGLPIVFRNPVGKGEVIYLGIDYFRIKVAGRTALDKMEVSKPARDFYRRIIFAGNEPLKKTDLIASGLQALKVQEPVIWRRDFKHARGAEYYATPYPKAGDEIKRISLILGRDEWETFPVNLSSPITDPDFTATIEDFISENGARIPAANMRLRLQGVVHPKISAGPFWLLDVQRQDHSFQIPLEKNRSYTLWVTLNTRGVEPGTYTGKIRWSRTAVEPLEVTVRVSPVRLPDRQYFGSESTYNWNSLFWLPDQKTENPFRVGQAPNMSLFEKHIKNLANHYSDYNYDSTWGGTGERSLSLSNIKLEGSDKYLEQAIKDKSITLDNLPPLDFSYFTPHIELPLEHGMPYFHLLLKNIPTQWLGYAKDITGNSDLEPNSPEHLKVKRWLYGESVRFLREKGIRKIVCFIADEIKPDKIPETITRARLLREFGIQVEFTATGEIEHSRELIAQMNPVTDRWIWNVTGLGAAKAIVNSTDSPVDSSDSQYSYLADWHRAPYVFNRNHAIFGAVHGNDGIYFHGYLRWYTNGGAVYAIADGPVDTEGWEGARDGIEDGRYLKRLQFLLDEAAKRPELAQDVQEIRKLASRWVTHETGSYIQLRNSIFGKYTFPLPDSGYGAIINVKEEMLQSIEKLQSQLKLVKSFTYDTVPIVAKSEALATVHGNEKARHALNGIITQRGSVGLPAATGQAKGPMILIGTKADPMIAEKVGVRVVVEPQPGSYKIFNGQDWIVIYAIDDAGATKGARILGHLLEQSEHVLP